MLNLFRKRHWQRINVEQYGQAYDRFGGSFITHPTVLTILADITQLQPSFYGRYHQGQLIGAVATWKHYLAGDKKAMRRFNTDNAIDLGYPEVILPLSPEQRFHIPFNARYLSAVHVDQVTNIKPNRDRSVMLVKPYDSEGISSKHHNTLKRKLTKFTNQGGEYRLIQDHQPDEIASIYHDLFYLRFNKKPLACKQLAMVFDKLHDFLYGYILYVDDKPVSIQINYQAKSSRYWTIDYINGGVDPSYDHLSVGSVLHYLNTFHAYQQAQTDNIPLRYSFGVPTFEYKQRWCQRVPVHKL